MHRFSLFSLIFLTFAAIVGCSSPVERQLESADTIMEETPDSALAILEAIPDSTLSSHRLSAYYALLLTQAKVKCDVPIPSDSLISIAADYYNYAGPDSMRMKSSFYLAQVRYNLSDYPGAINPAVEARDFAIALSRPYWQAKAAELLSFIYEVTFYREEALEMGREAADYYNKVGKGLNHIYSLYDIARYLSHLNQGKSAKNLLDSIAEIVNTHYPSSGLHNYILAQKFSIEVLGCEYEEAVEDFHTLIKNGYKPDLQDKALYARALVFTDKPVDIEYFKSKLSDSLALQEKLSILHLLFEAARKNGDYKTSKAYTDSVLALQDSTINRILKQSVITEQAKYQATKATNLSRETDRLRSLIITGVCVGAVIMILIVITFHYRLRLRNASLEQRMNDILILSQQLDAQTESNLQLQSRLDFEGSKLRGTEETIASLNRQLSDTQADEQLMREQIQSLFKKQWTAMNDLCHEYFERGDKKSSQAAMTARLDKEISAVTSRKNLISLEASVNSYLGNIIGRLREQCPDMNESDIRFILFSCAGFSPRAICLFMNLTLRNYYNKKTRIAERLLRSDAPDREEFAAQLSQRINNQRKTNATPDNAD